MTLIRAFLIKQWIPSVVFTLGIIFICVSGVYGEGDESVDKGEKVSEQQVLEYNSPRDKKTSNSCAFSIEYSPVFFNILNYGEDSAFIWGGAASGAIDDGGAGSGAFFDLRYYKATSSFERLSFNAKLFCAQIGYIGRHFGCSFGADTFDLKSMSFIYKEASGKSHKEEFLQDDFSFTSGRANIFFRFDSVGVAFNTGAFFGAGDGDDGDMYYFYGKGFIDWAAGCDFNFTWDAYNVNGRRDRLFTKFFYTKVAAALSTNDNKSLGSGAFDIFFAKVGYQIQVIKFSHDIASDYLKANGCTGFFITPHFAALSLSGDFSARVTNETQMYLFFPYKWFNTRGDLRATFCNAGADFLFNWTRDKFSVNLNYLFLADFSVDFKSAWLFKKNILFDGSGGTARGGFKMDDVSYNSLLFFAIGYEHRFFFSRRVGRYRHLSLFFNKTFLLPIDSGIGKGGSASGRGGGSSSSSGSSASISAQDVASYLLSLLEVGLKLVM